MLCSVASRGSLVPADTLASPCIREAWHCCRMIGRVAIAGHKGVVGQPRGPTTGQVTHPSRLKVEVSSYPQQAHYCLPFYKRWRVRSLPVVFTGVYLLPWLSLCAYTYEFPLLILELPAPTTFPTGLYSAFCPISPVGISPRTLKRNLSVTRFAAGVAMNTRPWISWRMPDLLMQSISIVAG